MNILDENVLESQRQLLQKWRVPFRQIGYEVGRKGMTDDEIILFLLSLRQPTFFSVDRHFYDRSLCHAQYGVVYLDVKQIEAATFVRRLLHHREFDTQAKRMGTVIRASHAGLPCGVFTLSRKCASAGQINRESRPRMHEPQTRARRPRRARRWASTLSAIRQ